jgi:septal ring factor EnvC (AmiA/AmiB activator)
MSLLTGLAYYFLQDELAELKKLRELGDQQLNEVRKVYKNQQTEVNGERKKASGLRTELDSISLRLFYLENAKGEVQSDISVMKRAAEKADSEVSKAEETKRKQDLFVNRLVEQLDRLREDIALYDAQFEAQAAETRAAREALFEAKTEIDAINVEKKQLFAAWNSALVGMRRRDEAHAAMAEAMRDQQQRMVTIEKEIEAFRRLTQQEQQNNEQLTVMLNKLEAEMATVKKMLAQCQVLLSCVTRLFSLL